jgi:hypothetical protein
VADGLGRKLRRFMLPSGDFFTQTNVMVPTAITVSPRTTVNSYSIERVFCRGEHVASRCFYQGTHA